MGVKQTKASRTRREPKVAKVEQQVRGLRPKPAAGPRMVPAAEMMARQANNQAIYQRLIKPPTKSKRAEA